ncbi:MAG: calcium/sodium antiporter [Candidatus Peribacteraceae bacterium]|nr:calcium/sodium antiporter [Candidatus Peribacteraceae bacterium]
MTFLLPVFFIAIGFALLIKGADWLVEGASSIARRLRISDLVIGLTIVSFGTSAPELVVNIFASLKGNADIAVGNIVGSNIANTLLILGVAAAIIPITVQKSTVFKEIPFCLLASLILFVMANDRLIDGYAASEIGRGDGMAFIGFFIIFLYYTFGIRKGNTGDGKEEYTKETRSILLASTMVGGGLIALTAGGELAVRGAVQVATILGVSESLIGLTIVAIGTSLPELVTSVLAAMKNKPDISVGNIVGSNIFNIFWILGISALIRPLPFASAINADLLVMIGAVFVLFLFIQTGHIHQRLLFWRMRKGHILHRWEGVTMLLLYAGYIGMLITREVL